MMSFVRNLIETGRLVFGVFAVVALTRKYSAEESETLKVRKDYPKTIFSRSHQGFGRIFEHEYHHLIHCHRRHY